MTEDMVKKSVDITQKDEKWLEDRPINFSKFVRRKIAERRIEEISDHARRELWKQLNSMVDKGEELREEWKQEREELKEKYDAEVVEKDRLYWRFKMNGSEWGTDWMAEEIYDMDDNEAEGEVREFAEKYTKLWQDKIGAFEEFVSEETSFEHDWQDEYGQTYNGTGFLSQFTISSNYVPTNIDSFTVKFEGRVDVPLRNLEKAVEE